MEIDPIEISEDIRESFPDDWPEWVLISLTELAATEAPLANGAFVTSLPDWSKSMLEEVMKPMLPKVKWRADGQTGVEFLGKTLGHQEYLFESDDVSNAMETQLTKINSAIQNPKRKPEEIYTSEQLQLLPELSQEIGKYWVSALECLGEIVDRKSEALKICRDRAFAQPFEIVQEFNRAYAMAQSTSIYNDEGNIDGLSVGNKIRTVLIMYKPLIEHKGFFTSLPALHKWIVQIHGFEILSFESFKKLCGQHGLRIASRGRPKK